MSGTPAVEQKRSQTSSPLASLSPSTAKKTSDLSKDILGRASEKPEHRSAPSRYRRITPTPSINREITETRSSTPDDGKSRSGSSTPDRFSEAGKSAREVLARAENRNSPLELNPFYAHRYIY